MEPFRFIVERLATKPDLTIVAVVAHPVVKTRNFGDTWVEDGTSMIFLTRPSDVAMLFAGVSMGRNSRTLCIPQSVPCELFAGVTGISD